MSLAVERRSLPEGKGFTLEKLPIPPSVNNLFANREEGGRFKTDRYRTWRNTCGQEVMAQRVGAVRGPVALTYTFERNGTKADLGNLEKAATDLLVWLRLIDGDGPDVVQQIVLRWGAVEGCQIKVEPVRAA